MAVIERCPWPGTDSLYVRYHDEQWGVPVHDDRLLFEMLVLEGMQAGLSWITILRKRENFRAAFDGFDPLRVAGYGPEKVEELLQNPGIIRNRLKVQGAIRNARAFLTVQQAYGSFDAFIWGLVGGVPRQNRWRTLAEIPASTPESDAVSKTLKQHGFSFVGSTVCYAHMQATGMVNDHLVTCFRYTECARMG
ncbi:MAG: DNA-3-methyladenine glycosylase I [Anaerolineae bacterium]|nr:DNA-3-methyladenine glycosylase I [Anaerolineae bacterium]